MLSSFSVPSPHPLCGCSSCTLHFFVSAVPGQAEISSQNRSWSFSFRLAASYMLSLCAIEVFGLCWSEASEAVYATGLAYHGIDCIEIPLIQHTHLPDLDKLSFVLSNGRRRHFI